MLPFWLGCFCLLLSLCYGQENLGTPIAGGATTPVNLIPHAPAGPAPGASTPTANSSFTSTANQPFDYFSGIAYRQLATVQQQWELVKTAAAAASGVAASEGARIFGKQAYYILSLWFPDKAQSIGLRPLTNESDFGGVLVGSSYWNDEQADFQASRFGRCMDRLIFHLVRKDPVGYARKEDDVAFEAYLRNKAHGNSPQEIITLFLYEPTVLSATVNYFLGTSFTPEVQSAFAVVFRFITWRLTVVTDLYVDGYYKRYMPRVRKDQQERPLDFIPVEQQYAIASNGTYNCTDDSSCVFALVDPDGFPVPLQRYGRADESATLTSVTVVQPSSGLPRAPAPVDGSPALNLPPYSATVGKRVDPFTGMTYNQLELALSVWNRIKAAAALATGVPASIGYDPWSSQAVVIYTTWHPETLEIFTTPAEAAALNNVTNDPSNYYPAEPFFNNPLVTGFVRTVGIQSELRFTALATGNLGQYQRAAEAVVFAKYNNNTRNAGGPQDSLASYMWINEGRLAAADYFLGNQLDDAGYSAFESMINFVHLTNYEQVHSYNIARLHRPFASDFEMIGKVPANLVPSSTPRP